MHELQEVRAQYAREAGRYDRRWSRYVEGTIGSALQALDPPPTGRVLDVGCGTGVLLERIREAHPGVRACGADPSPEMIAEAGRRLGDGVHLVIADVHRLPFAGGAFDVVVSTSAMHHWTRPEAALGEIARILRPGGRLVLTDWNDDFLALRLYSRLLRLTDASHHRSYTAARARELVRDAGLVVDGVQAFRATWLWGMMTLTARRA